jgi:pyruvate dehydrogenase E1 component
MDAMFPSAKIYNPHGQNYDSVDRKILLAYKESPQGQLLHEGISEAGAMASTTAAGSSYSTHDEPMIPVYIFYSMFGFQRTADSIWAMADQLARGFLIGATAGRTTLTGEGLQHADGHSPLIARTNPAVIHYDPAFAFEIRHIVRSGLERMYGPSGADGNGEDVIFYLTVYNEPISQPVEPENLDVEGVLKGAYLYRRAPQDSAQRAGIPVRIMASGVAVPWALRAQGILAEQYGVAADVWSVTSWNEIAREAVETERWNLNHAGEEYKKAWISTALAEEKAVTLAVSDYMRAVSDQIAPWVPGGWESLGTDGFGFADTRAAARRAFQVDTESIVVGVLQGLAERGHLDRAIVAQAFADLRLDDPTAVAGQVQEGGDA